MSGILVTVGIALLPACGSAPLQVPAPRPLETSDARPPPSRADPALAEADGRKAEELLDRLQRHVEAAVEPFDHAEQTISDIADLTKYLAQPGRRRVDAKRLMAEAAKVVAGQAAGLAQLGLDSDLLDAATERFARLGALTRALRAAPADQERLRGELAEATSTLSRLMRLRRNELIPAELDLRLTEYRQRIDSLDRAREVQAKLDRMLR
jgi:hypothetical protein